MKETQSRPDKKLDRKIAVARFNLVLGRLWIASRTLLTLVLVFIGVTLLGIWEFVSPYLHALGLVIFAGLLIYTLHLLRREFYWPSTENILKELEEKNSLQHRPLRSQDEQLALGAETPRQSEALWQQHLQQKQKSLETLKTGFPNLGLAAGDALGLRSFAILLLVVGFFFAGGSREDRLAAAFWPEFPTQNNLVELNIWITPPDYTGKAPLLLARQLNPGEQAVVPLVKIPHNSQLIARVSGGNTAVPRFVFGQTPLAFKQVDGTNFELETLLDTDGGLKLEKDGDLLGEWRVEMIPDNAPEIKLISLPEVTQRLAFSLQYSAFDDYGLKKLRVEFSRKGKSEKLVLPLPFRTGEKDYTGRSFHELTAHPWAGLDVELQLVATDDIEQEGKSETLLFTLPERSFTHPIARALIELRKKLVEDAKKYRNEVVIALSAISELHEGLNNDFTAMLLIAHTRGMLLYGDVDEVADEAIRLMWDTALRLENGNLGAAEQALRAAEQALMEALNRDASDEEIKRLVEELKQAMQNYLQALAEQSREQDPAQQNADQGQEMQTRDLQNMLDQVDQFARSGARDAARQLLSELQSILENLKAARMQQPSEAQRRGQEMLNQLNQMMQEQQNILDETFRRSQQPGSQQRQRSQNGSGERSPSQSGQSPEFSDLAKRQEQLRQQLGEMMGELGLNGEIPAPFGQAERAMNSARQSLEQGQSQNAMGAEGQALEQLRDAASGLAQQMQGQGNGQAFSMPGSQGQSNGFNNRDGPNGQGPYDRNGIKVDEGELSKSRAIQQELRRRLADPNRSPLETDYLRRLMERFR
ncbi:MAG: TIGR02302 family protein [Sneathiellales bacterium]|nr:TIGR02302 family protein [Sneathiellales bacterium]